MLENGEDCRLKEYLIAGPCQGMGACTEDWGKASLGAAAPGASVVMVRWALAAFHLPETAALGYDPHSLGQHDMKWGSSAPQQCRLSDQHSSLSAELSVVWKSLLPFLKHFLAIRKLPECRQVVRDPWKKPRIWRTLKLRGGQWIAIMVCFLNRWFLSSRTGTMTECPAPEMNSFVCPDWWNRTCLEEKQVLQEPLA